MDIRAPLSPIPRKIASKEQKFNFSGIYERIFGQDQGDLISDAPQEHSYSVLNPRRGPELVTDSLYIRA